VVAFLRSEGRQEDAAYEFFRGLWQKPSLEGAPQGLGRFRSYLLGALKHFVAR